MKSHDCHEIAYLLYIIEHDLMTWCVTNAEPFVPLDFTLESQIEGSHVMGRGLLLKTVQPIWKCTDIGQIFIKCSDITMAGIIKKYHRIRINETRFRNPFSRFRQLKLRVTGEKLQRLTHYNYLLLHVHYYFNFQFQFQFQWNCFHLNEKIGNNDQPVWVLVVCRHRQYCIPEVCRRLGAVS